MKINNCPVCNRSEKHKGACRVKYSSSVDIKLENHYIWCDNCGLKGPYGEDKEDAIKKWNNLRYGN